MASISIPADELLVIIQNKPKDDWIDSLIELCEIGIISSRPITLSMDDVQRIGFDEFK